MNHVSRESLQVLNPIFLEIKKKEFHAERNRFALKLCGNWKELKIIHSTKTLRKKDAAFLVSLITKNFKIKKVSKYMMTSIIVH